MVPVLSYDLVLNIAYVCWVVALGVEACRLINNGVDKDLI